MTMTIEIPALDRLCTILEDRTRAEVLEELKEEIIAQLKANATKKDAPTLNRLEFVPVEAPDDHPWKDEAQAAPEGQKGPQEPPKPEPTNVSPEPEAPKPAAAPATLAAVQSAAAQMRDAGKLNTVTDMFAEFGIAKLSDLKGDALQAFAERLRAMGAKL